VGVRKIQKYYVKIKVEYDIIMNNIVKEKKK